MKPDIKINEILGIYKIIPDIMKYARKDTNYSTYNCQYISNLSKSGVVKTSKYIPYILYGFNLYLYMHKKMMFKLYNNDNNAY